MTVLQYLTLMTSAPGVISQITENASLQHTQPT